MTELFEKLKKQKALPFVLFALISGIFLLVMPQSGSTSKESGGAAGETREYVEYLEEKAANIICEMSGVKRCTVMISVKGGYKSYYASNQRVTQNGETRDAQKEYVTVGGGDSALLTEQRMPEVLGVAVVCPGISAETEYRVMSLVSALFDVPTNRISISK